jgi:hypothetical protein
MDCKCAIVQSSCRVVECYRAKLMQRRRLDGASPRDLSLNLLQGGEIDNRLRINQLHSQSPPVWRGSDEGDMEGKKWWAKNFRAPSQGDEE